MVLRRAAHSCPCLPCLLAYRAKRRRRAAYVPKRGSLVLPLAGSAAHREGCPNRFGRVLTATRGTRVRPTAPRGTCWPGSTPALCGSIWRWGRRQIPPRGLLGALSSPPQARSLCFPPPVGRAAAAGAGPLVISAQNDLAVGSRRPKRRWEAATHRKRVPAQRKAAAERQLNNREIVSSSPAGTKAAHQQRCRPSRTPPSSSSMLLVYQPSEAASTTIPMGASTCTPRAQA